MLRIRFFGGMRSMYAGAAIPLPERSCVPPFRRLFKKNDNLCKKKKFTNPCDILSSLKVLLFMKGAEK